MPTWAKVILWIIGVLFGLQIIGGIILAIATWIDNHQQMKAYELETDRMSAASKAMIEAQKLKGERT